MLHCLTASIFNCFRFYSKDNSSPYVCIYRQSLLKNYRIFCKIKGAGLTDGKEENSPLHISVHNARPKNLFKFFFKSVFIIHFINKKNIRYTKAYVSLLN